MSIYYIPGTDLGLHIYSGTDRCALRVHHLPCTVLNVSHALFYLLVLTIPSFLSLAM